MAVTVHVANDRQIISPVRITRAVTGLPVLDAPDIDDRGWAMPRPTGWNVTDARGPMIGITKGDTVRLKVVREDIDDAVDLYATISSESPPQVQITEPSGGGPLPADGVFKVEALDDNDTANKIEIRIGSASGPVIAEAEPHVFSKLTLRVVPHVVTINSASTPGTAPPVSLNTWFNTARAILRPAGIDISVGSTVNTTLNNFAFQDIALFAANHPSGTNEMATLVSTGFVANRCNIFFVRFMDTLLGVGVNREAMIIPAISFPNPAIVIGVVGSQTSGGGSNRASGTLNQEMGNDIAHEIGHFLTLTHAAGVNAPGRRDTFTRRNLMHPNNPLPTASVRERDIGYGQDMRGGLVTLKRFSFYSNDGQVARMRRRLRQPNNVKY